MTPLAAVAFAQTDISTLADVQGAIAIFLGPNGSMDVAARRVNRLTRGAVARVAESAEFEKLSDGGVLTLAFPSGMVAELVIVGKIPKPGSATVARLLGAAVARAAGNRALSIQASSHRHGAEVLHGAVLRRYDFTDHKTGSGAGDPPEPITLVTTDPEKAKAAAAPLLAVAEGVFFTRDLTNAPSNILTTTEFADQLAAMADLGLEIEILEEDRLAELGMGALLGVGQGSRSPTKIVVMKWMGGGDEAPFAVVGKGVVFDTGGISLKPAGGMEDMTMDMGGAGVVAGVMRGLSRRKAAANVVGLVGLVENMPDGNAQRPGDVVTSMKGDTIEVINTDAEGRLVLADVLWYAQETYAPSGIINLATLTGAIIIGLGHYNAGLFANDDTLAANFLKAAETEDEGAWRMPLGPKYDKLIKSRVADMANVGGRAAGSITAAQFLQRFIKPGTPWMHIDIAGVASLKEDTDYAPKGATGWGVRSIDRMIAQVYETNKDG